MEADQLGRLNDILNAARLIASYVKDTTQEEFDANTEKQDAIVRRLEIIGEATVHLNETTRQAIPGLPFRRMRGMRNVVAHDYDELRKHQADNSHEGAKTTKIKSKLWSGDFNPHKLRITTS